LCLSNDAFGRLAGCAEEAVKRLGADLDADPVVEILAALYTGDGAAGSLHSRPPAVPDADESVVAEVTTKASDEAIISRSVFIENGDHVDKVDKLDKLVLCGESTSPLEGRSSALSAAGGDRYSRKGATSVKFHVPTPLRHCVRCSRRLATL
jgi:hypothetical protein